MLAFPAVIGRNPTSPAYGNPGTGNAHTPARNTRRLVQWISIIEHDGARKKREVRK